MPIPFPSTYDTLCNAASKGQWVPYGGACDGCGRKSSYFFTGKSVTRGAVVGNGDEHRPRYRRLQIPLARCDGCGRWARVLPQDVLPRKTYGIGVIELGARRYVFTPDSLREAVRGITDRAEDGPHHSTLHR